MPQVLPVLQEEADELNEPKLPPLLALEANVVDISSFYFMDHRGSHLITFYVVRFRSSRIVSAPLPKSY